MSRQANKPSDRMPPTFEREAAAHARGFAPVAGCDEAGRGPWAGPVVAAAVILDPGCVPRGLDDSKRLTPKRREELFAEICACSEVAVALAPPSRIARDNILHASLWALARAVCALPRTPRMVFVDGPYRPPLDEKLEVEAIVGGDGLVVSIAAASIVAKVTRDCLMSRLGAAFPAYGFERHKGYGTGFHAEMLKRYGPTPHHRANWEPVIAVRGPVAVED